MGYGYGMVRCGRLWVRVRLDVADWVRVRLDVADYGLGLG